MTMTVVLRMQVTWTVTLKNAKLKVCSRSTHNLNVENQMLNSERLTCKVGLSFKSVWLKL